MCSRWAVWLAKYVDVGVMEWFQGSGWWLDSSMLAFVMFAESGDWTKDIIIWQGWVRMRNLEMNEDELWWERWMKMKMENMLWLGIELGSFGLGYKNKERLCWVYGEIAYLDKPTVEEVVPKWNWTQDLVSYSPFLPLISEGKNCWFIYIFLR